MNNADWTKKRMKTVVLGKNPKFAQTASRGNAVGRPRSNFFRRNLGSLKANYRRLREQFYDPQFWTDASLETQDALVAKMHRVDRALMDLFLERACYRRMMGKTGNAE